MTFVGLFDRSWPFWTLMDFLALLAYSTKVDLQINLGNFTQPLVAFAFPFRPFWPFHQKLIYLNNF
jgi:hypothetical protein